MRRSWWFVGLWLLSLIFAFFFAERNRSVAFSVAYLLTAIVVISFLWSWMNVRWVRIGRYTRSRRSQVGRVAEEQFEASTQRVQITMLSAGRPASLPGP